jgi:proline dehydrogenase
MKILDRMIVGLLPAVPKPVVRRIADRYIAGETIDDAVAVLRSLNAEGCEGTVDVLGEFITEFREAEETAAAYHEILERICSDRLRSNVSIKLTALGLKLDAEGCYGLVKRLVERARELANFVRIDMEDSSVTTATLDLYRRLRADRLDNVGVVIQAYLRRSANDVAALLPLRPSIRLCKGIYVEPPEIAFKDREEIRRSYRSLLRRILEEGASRLGIATHDPPLIEDALAYLKEKAIPQDRYEFQMLLGVAAPLRRRLVSQGHTMRVYVPYGRAWYGYSLRRIKENPSIAGYVVKGMFRW